MNTEYYFDSLYNDIKNAKEEITINPTYIILNLCRVLAYKNDELILSKQEGGNWGITHISKQYHELILQALDEYMFDKVMELDEDRAKDYATYMINQIKVG